MDHDDIYKDDSLPREVAKLISLWSDLGCFRAPEPMVDVPAVAYRAHYSCRFHHRWLRANQATTVRVKITNSSNHRWPPGAESGLHLGYRWLDETGKPSGDPGLSVALPSEVLPGRSIALRLTITASADRGCHLLEIDLVDEGVAWFSDKKSQHPTNALRLKVHIMDFKFLNLFTRSKSATTI